MYIPYTKQRQVLADEEIGMPEQSCFDCSQVQALIHTWNMV